MAVVTFATTCPGVLPRNADTQDVRVVSPQVLLEERRLLGLRETLNRNPALTNGITVGIIVVTIGFVLWRLTRGETGAEAGPSTNLAFFSDDDGATFFTDDRSKIPPFDHNGKPAVTAVIFTCDGGKTKWVGYLRRFTAEAKKRREDILKQAKGQPTPILAEVEDVSGIEIKKPKTGESAWVKESDPGAEEVRNIKCPHNGAHEPELVPGP
jgi:hypothetical protein